MACRCFEVICIAFFGLGWVDRRLQDALVVASFPEQAISWPGQECVAKSDAPQFR